MRRYGFAAATLLLVLTLAGCASSGSGTRSRSSDSAITLEELQDMQNFTVYQAVRRLRPRWLRTRAPQTSLVVHLNGNRVGGAEFLEIMEVIEVSQISFMNGPDATTRFGTGYGAGVILIQTRRRVPGG